MESNTYYGIKAVYQDLVVAINELGYFKWCDLDYGQAEEKQQEFSI